MGAAPDVAVIGGGIVGASTAAFLAQAGARVVLYEREGLAAGASGANSGVVQFPFDQALIPLHESTVDLYRRLSDSDAGFRMAEQPTGLLLVAHREDVVRRTALSLASSLPQLRPEFLDSAALRALEPAMAPGVAACRVDIGYPVPPAASTYAYATLAERSGAILRLGHSATPVIRSGRAIGCRVDGSLEPAGAIVAAAGPWTPELIDPSGAWRPIRPLWGVVVETHLETAPHHVMEEAEMDEALGIGDPDDAMPAGAPRPEFSLVTAAGTSAIGSTFLDDEPDPTSWTVPVLTRAASFVPMLAAAPIRGVRSCARPLALDGRPLIGAVPGADGLYVCAGHGPWGISTGPGSARLIADLILGRQPAISAAVDVARFGVPTRAGSPAEAIQQVELPGLEFG